MSAKLKVGVVGCGAIGGGVASIISERDDIRAEIVALYDVDNSKAKVLSDKIKTAEATSLDRLIELSDLVLESASAKVSYEIAKKALAEGKSCLVMSIGGVLGKEKELFELAEKNNTRLHFPSGAICGIDGIESLKIAGIDEITLNTYKPPAGLKGADYLVEHNIDVSSIREEKLVFSGTAQEAVSAFPKNINIVALLSIASSGQVVPHVNIYVSPSLKRNIHVIKVKSKAGQIEIRCENVPSPDNPKTSFMAVLSAVAAVSKISG